MKKKWTFLIILLIASSIPLFSQQASLTIVNKSNRSLSVKIMKGIGKKATLYKTDKVSPKGTQVIYFSETGRYFTKTQAVLLEKDTLDNDTLYSKDNPFEVISDPKRGYSNITMTFKVKESKKPVLEGSAAITRKEYNDN
jgi:hypothetical protein